MTHSQFIKIMAGIALAMIVSWFAIDFAVGFDSFGDLPIGLILIAADLSAFVVIGAVLKKRVVR